MAAASNTPPITNLAAMGETMIQIHDYVAVMADVENTPIARGTTGTVVSKLSDTHFWVEFSDSEGQVYEQAAIHRDNLLVLHQITENLEVD